MKVIGLTGNIACGKTVVARMFEELGAKIIDADYIARLIVEPGEPAWKDIVEKFGHKILNPDGTINRKKLGDIVFRDIEKREELNRTTHPRIIDKIESMLEEYRKENIKVVIVEAALILEKGGMKPIISDLMVVAADEEAQIKRLIERDGISREEALTRIKAQMPVSEKVKFATYVIDNSRTLEETRKQVEEVWKKINA
ncbi:MAG TPA: dephospho-CoA kinase [Thermodesulfobacteriota bacterium]|nr:dephospho-CoA kinase [Thermodesulfobacteriota bacterium]